MRAVGGTAQLLLLVVVLMLGTALSRETRTAGDPALSLPPGAIWVQCGSGFPQPGAIRQIGDGSSVASVIGMTGLAMADDCEVAALRFRVQNGATVAVDAQGGIIKAFSVEWMPAAQRAALGVPLHPDRMQGTDWLFLPGVGPTLAARIDRNRQENGEFGSLLGLQRVSGIGSRRIEAWSPYFFSELSAE